MSTSLLYHAFGVVGYFYRSTCFIAGVIIIAIQADHWRLRCPVCKSREIHCRGKLVIPITDRNSNNIAFTFGRGHHGTEGKWDGAT